MRDENETCLRGDESICASGLFCAQLESTVGDYCSIDWDESLLTSRCYKMCSAQSDCRSGQNCNLCLQVPGYDGVGLCWPPDVNLTDLKRPLGAKCTKDSQCASELCMNNGEQKACSQPCSYYTQSGCPSAGVNELGLEFTCLRSTTDGYCWPTTEPVSVVPGEEDEKEVYGCDCQSGRYDPFMWLILFMGALVIWRKRGNVQDSH